MSNATVFRTSRSLQHEDASTTGVSSVRQFVFSGAKTPKYQVQAALKEVGNISRTIERFFRYPQLVQLSRNVFTVRLWWRDFDFLGYVKLRIRMGMGAHFTGEQTDRNGRVGSRRTATRRYSED
jgi:hypothetical protein